MKKLDFSGGFLSVIRDLVGILSQNTPLRVLQPSLKRSHLKYPLKSLAAKSKTIPPSNQTPIFIAIFD
ncbi:hypothetical protein [Helicobacter pylori]|uniref:hypothetical protein n=1 Tax=Helicobacter pylori TaxID=210 RepID=UPI0035A8339B